MTPARALAVFTVRQRGIRVDVRVLPTIADVDAEYYGRPRSAARRERRRVHAYFTGGRRPARVAGIVVLPADGRLAELVPHEVVHAVVHASPAWNAPSGAGDGGAAGDDDEELALSVGLLSGAIFSELRRRGIEVRP
ncbi:MAG: hypothetical protein A3H93_09090 [Rhodocyclales bacterium RIFCSPLOWO2_02_FULL_63_24]|nr:MAG: hypothetical protein A3H93_09090 [Rhodocyclales bacterium RIFCSPLOWO2_02_FULL_63_24]